MKVTRYAVVGVTGLLCVTVAGCSSPARALVPPTTAQLTAVNLRPGDLPSGWKATPDTSNNNDDARESALGATCAGIRDTMPDQVATSQSDDFNLGMDQVSAVFDSYRTAADVKADSSLISSPKASACFREVATGELSAAFGTGTKAVIDGVDVGGRAAGDPAQVVGRVVVGLTVTGTSGSITVAITRVFIAAGLVEVEVDFTSAGAPFPAGIESTVVAALAGRTAKL